MAPHFEKPFDRCYWVVPDKLLAGCYPGSEDPAVAASKLRGLLNCGIRRVVNLMEVHETNHYGDWFASYEEPLVKMAASSGVEIRCLRFPVRDMSIPSEEFMVRILNAIDESIDHGLPVYVHCWGGVGRTGTVVGCYLARHDIATGKECLNQIKELRRGDPTSYRNSPETRQQRQMVIAWRPGQ